MLQVIGKLIGKINIHSLKSKMILSIIMIFTLFIAVSVANNMAASRIIIDKIENSVTNSVRQTEDYLSVLFTQATSIGFTLSKNAYLESLSNKETALEESFYERYRAVSSLGKDIEYISEVNREIDSVYIYIPNINTVLIPGYRLYREDFIRQSNDEWMKFESSEGKVYSWIGHFADSGISGKNLISFVCRADKLNMDKVESQVNISVNFDETQIYNIIKKLKITQNCRAYLYDSQGSIISCEDKSQLHKSIQSITGSNINALKSDKLNRIKMNGSYYLAIGVDNYTTKWSILVLIPENELLAENRAYSRVMTGLVFFLGIVLILIAIRFVLLHIDKPMAKLVKHMKDLEKGIFDNEIREERKDEFGYVFKKYNEMIIKMRNLIKELYQEKLLKREAELKVLQSQINPHFLYNTLDAINWIAKVNNVSKISNMVNALSNLYRSSFNRGMDLIKVRDLLFSMENYIYIQKIRYGDSFNSTIVMDERVGDYDVLNLILQPIVENAIIHGLGDKEKDGILNVTAGIEDNTIVFTVQDNGCGMNEKKLMLVNASLGINSPSSSDSGMRNVNKRIKLYYGEQYGVTVTSSLADGTSVRVVVPILQNSDKKELSDELLA